jgi:hypothetical protein
MYAITRGIQVMACRPIKLASVSSGCLLMRLFSSTGFDVIEDSLPDQPKRLKIVDRKEYQKAYHKANCEKNKGERDHAEKYSAEYRHKLRDAILDQRKRYHAENAVAIMKKLRAYYMENAAAINE